MIASRHDCSGFTLVEVLIAIGLFVVIALGEINRAHPSTTYFADYAIRPDSISCH